ncbi:UDP-N-acetylmuramoyl-L-alanine--D-glutamate ligase [Alteribacter natronophilus]|uniref:UDP-N-acetylmuramoyl-L-alanine--D-glutamate ligase n=1 Tax=Alteribacter natronophilus TaxID=2583810 RepID=UPI00110E1F14|nr:UDP-N-acetylmuramoyl-L-alanine--D-glutamate ligase [Alteribacter natronophilus]TMW73125.1 UDP-N-acetylmuramoyl-L-alanine--D-glutamate ligase [Alteribacter natronophilus]
MKNISKYRGKEVLVLGLAKSGTAAAELLHSLGAKVTVNDQKPLEENEAARKLQESGCTVVCGEHPLSLVHSDLAALVKNPGIRYDNPLVERAVKLGVPVITEVELAYEISEAPFIGITGSNGKTTTTMLAYEILKKGSRTPRIAGNIGQVSCEVASDAASSDVLVTELSSFQLMGTRSFKPEVAVLLNIIDAHLDYHGTRKAYAEAKGRLFANTDEQSVLVYNCDDPEVKRLAEQACGIKKPFSVRQKLTRGGWLEDGWLMIDGKPLLHRDDMSLPGDHNIENALAAALASTHYGVDRQAAAEVLKTFSGVRHRLQFVEDLNGRQIYNNSKATNIPATVTALKAFERPVVLIAGGLDRGNEFEDLEPWLKKRVHGVVTYGQTASKIASAAENAGVHTIQAGTLEEAVPLAYELTRPGDVLLLSPACASWDQFRTFEERGDCFISAVEKLDR